MNHTLHQQLVQLRCDAADWVDGLPAEGFSPWRGICHHLDLSAEGRNQFDVLLAAWPDGTGNKEYPVPHPLLDPFGAYVTVSWSEKWNPEFEYARNRWALLEWLIEQTASEADQ